MEGVATRGRVEGNSGIMKAGQVTGRGHIGPNLGYFQLPIKCTISMKDMILNTKVVRKN